MPKWTLANLMDLYLYPRHFEPLFREFFGKAARFCSRQNVEFEQAFLLVLLDRHSECMCHCVDTGKAQNTLSLRRKPYFRSSDHMPNVSLAL